MGAGPGASCMSAIIISCGGCHKQLIRLSTSGMSLTSPAAVSPQPGAKVSAQTCRKEARPILHIVLARYLLSRVIGQQPHVQALAGHRHPHALLHDLVQPPNRDDPGVGPANVRLYRILIGELQGLSPQTLLRE